MITPEMIREYREATGASMRDAKKYFQDIEDAKEKQRKKDKLKAVRNMDSDYKIGFILDFIEEMLS